MKLKREEKIAFVELYDKDELVTFWNILQIIT